MINAYGISLPESLSITDENQTASDSNDEVLEEIQTPDGTANQKVDSEDSEKLSPADDSHSDETIGSHHSHDSDSDFAFSTPVDSSRDSDSDSHDSNSQIRLRYDSDTLYYDLDSSFVDSDSTSQHSVTEPHYGIEDSLVKTVTALPCKEPYTPEPSEKGVTLSTTIRMKEYSEETISTVFLFLPILTTLSHYIAEHNAAALDQLFPLSPSSIFFSPDPPSPLLLDRGVGIYIALDQKDEEDLREANRYLAPNLDADDPDSFTALSGEEKEASLVYSLGLTMLFRLVHTPPLSEIDDPKEAHYFLRSAPDDAINKLLSRLSGNENESLISLIQLMLSSDPSKRPPFTAVLQQLEKIAHAT